MSTASASRALTFARSGKDGKAGDFMEYRYAEGELKRGPTYVAANREPAGWSLTLPTAPTGRYIWRIQAKINGDTDELLTPWGSPTRITPYDGVDGAKGADGAAGSRGPALRGPQYWNVCPSGYQFMSGKDGEQWIDVVIYAGQYYVCKTSHTKSLDNYPGSRTDQSGGYWQLGDKVDMVATKVLLAEYSVIKNLGAEAIEMRDADGNVVFEAKDGNVICQTGTFNNVNVQTGQVAGFGIEGNGLINTGFDNDAYIIIRHDEQKAFAGIGGNVLSAVMGARAVAKFTNLYDKDTSTTATNYGAIIAAQGARTNVAMLIDGGCVQGYAMSNLVISAASNVTRTLTRAQNNVLAIGSAIASVYLPAMELHDDGHVIRFKSLIPSPGGIRIYTSACKTYNGTATRTSKPVIIYGRGEYITGTNYLPVENVGDAMEFIWVRDIVVTISGTTYYGAWVQYKFPRDW